MGRMMSKADMLIRTEMHTISGKKKPVQILNCTERNCKTRFKTSIPTTPELVVHQAREKGWLINLSNKSCLCPEHSVKKEEPIVTTQLTKPREMSPEDRRRIFREIDENYVAKSYIEDVTDKTIGEKLTVPWAWVAKIRERTYGSNHDAVSAPSERRGSGAGYAMPPKPSTPSSDALGGRYAGQLAVDRAVCAGVAARMVPRIRNSARGWRKGAIHRGNGRLSFGRSPATLPK